MEQGKRRYGQAASAASAGKEECVDIGEVTYSFNHHFSRGQLMRFYRLLGKEVLTVETVFEDGIYN